MAKKQNRISINKLEKFCNRNDSGIVNAKFEISSEEVVEYEIKTRLSLEECVRFVNDVVIEYVRPGDSMIISIAKQFIIHRGILTYYSNFSMPEDDRKAFNLVMGAREIVDNILSVIDQSQYHMILNAIDESILFEQQKMLSVQETRVNEVVSEVNQFVNRMSGLFDGVDGNQISSFISGISQLPSISAEDLANAVVQRTEQ